MSVDAEIDDEVDEVAEDEAAAAAEDISDAGGKAPPLPAFDDADDAALAGGMRPALAECG